MKTKTKSIKTFKENLDYSKAQSILHKPIIKEMYKQLYGFDIDISCVEENTIKNNSNIDYFVKLSLPKSLENFMSYINEYEPFESYKVDYIEIKNNKKYKELNVVLKIISSAPIEDFENIYSMLKILKTNYIILDPTDNMLRELYYDLWDNQLQKYIARSNSQNTAYLTCNFAPGHHLISIHGSSADKDVDVFSINSNKLINVVFQDSRNNSIDSFIKNNKLPIMFSIEKGLTGKDFLTAAVMLSEDAIYNINSISINKTKKKCITHFKYTT